MSISSPIQLNAKILEIKDECRPRTYILNKGWSEKVCEWVKTPEIYLDQLLINNSFSINSKSKILNLLHKIKMFAQSSVFAFAGIIGRGVDEILHEFNAERIKKDDYDREFSEWMKKTYIGFDAAYMKHFIDFCIRNRFKAVDCPHTVIIEQNFNLKLKDEKNTLIVMAEAYSGIIKNTPLYNGKGTSLSQFVQNISDVWSTVLSDRTSENPLVLIHSDERSEGHLTKNIRDHLKSKISLNTRLNSDEIKEFLKNAIIQNYDVIQKSTYTVFRFGELSTQKEIDYHRNAIVSEA